MKNLRRLAGLALCLCALLLFLPGRAEAAGTGTCGDNLSWTLDENGVLTISGSGDMMTFTGEYDDGDYYTDNPWYYRRSAIRSIVFTDGVASVSDGAFSNCANLTSVSFPAGFTSIGASAFSGCAQLAAPAFPSSLVTIGGSAFSNCSGMTALSLPDGLRSIGARAFSGCGLPGVSIPASVVSIGDNAFSGTAFTSFSVDEGNEYYQSVDGVLFSKDGRTLVRFPQARTGSYTVPAGTETLGAGAFSSSSLSELSIPEGVTSLGSEAFSFCLLTALPLPESLRSIGSYAFSYSRLASITLPAEITRLGSCAFSCCSSLKNIRFQGSAPVIAGDCFSGTKATVLYPVDDGSWTESVRQNYGGTLTWSPAGTIHGTCGDSLAWSLDEEGELLISGTGAMPDYTAGASPWYAYRSRIQSLAVEEEVTSLGSCAFTGCDSLHSVTLPQGLTAIGENTFSNCGELTGIDFPETLTTIGNHAFDNCYRLASVRLPSALSSVGSYAFARCALSEVTVPSSVAVIGEAAFFSQGLTGITVEEGNPFFQSVGGILFTKDAKALVCFPAAKTGAYTIPEGTETIGAGAFTGAKLSSVTVPGSVASIGDRAFSSCTNLSRVTLSQGLESIGGSAFSSCSALTRITLPMGLRSIGSYAFSYCSNLRELVLPRSVTSFGSSVFDRASALSHVGFLGTEQEWYAMPAVLRSAVGTPLFNNGSCSETLNRLRWSISDDGILTVTGSGAMKNYSLIGSNPYLYSSAPWSVYRDMLREVVLPEGLTEISNYAFYSCGVLDTLHLPSSFTELGSYAFEYCFRLTDVYFRCSEAEAGDLGARITTSSPGAAIHYSITGECGDNDSNLRWVLEDNGTLLITGSGAMADYTQSSASYGSTAPWCPYRNSISHILITKDVTGIGAWAFYGIPATTLTIQNASLSIGRCAFADCSLTDVSFGTGNVEIAGYMAFGGNRQLETLTIPAGTSFGSDSAAFSDCSALRTVTINGRNVGDSTFLRCTALESVTLNGVQEIGPWAFEGCTALHSVTVPASVQSIGLNAFRSSVNSVTFLGQDTVLAEDLFTAAVNTHGSTAHITVTAPLCSTAHAYCLRSHNYETLTFRQLPDDAAAHSYGEPVWSWSEDLSEASAAFTCRREDDSQTVDAVITAEITEASCTQDGATVYTAMVAFGGETFTDQRQEILPVLGHEPGEPVQENEVPATCTADGSYDSVVICTRCGEELSRDTLTIPALGHDIVTADPEWVWAEDLFSAVVRFHCSRCDFYDEVEAEIWDGPTRTEPTHTAEGRIVAFAYADYGNESYDGDMEVRIPALGHDYAQPQWNWNDDHMEAEAMFACSCGDIQTVEAKVTVSEVPASHSEAGIRSYLASAVFENAVWEDEYSEVISRIPHTYESPSWFWAQDHTSAQVTLACACGEVQIVEAVITSQRTEPTHTSDGAVVYTAEAIFGDHSYTDTETEILPALGHDYGAPFWRWAEDGSSAQYVAACSCGAELITEATVTPGSSREPTCTAAGEARFLARATYAGSTYRDTKTIIYPALGHDWGEWETVTEPSCTEEGSEQRSCTRCSETETRVLDALGHDYHDIVTEPTCTEPGFTTHTCARCSDSFADSCTDALGHELGEPVQENYTEPSYDTEGRYDEVISCKRCGEELSRTHVTIPALTPEKPKITRQPVDYTGPVGSTASFTVEVQGECLTYQWYVKKLTASRFSKSSITGPVYEVELTSARNGNQLYCVVTDARGNSVQTDTVTMSVEHGLSITRQPVDYTGPVGSTVSFTVEATGGAEPLTYQWYVKKLSASRFSKSSITGPVYEVELTEARNGNRLYCVVTDALGNSVTSDTVSMTISDPLTIIAQPADYRGPEGSTASFTVEATGGAEPLTYQWYVKKLSASRFSKSSITGPVYEVELTSTRNGNQLYCVVTDAQGNSVRTDTVTMSVEHGLSITRQPVDYTGPVGSTASFTVEATGGVEPLTYQWYVKKLSASRFSKSSITGPVYEVELTSARNGNQLYCIVTDAAGNTVQTGTVSMTIG